MKTYNIEDLKPPHRNNERVFTLNCGTTITTGQLGRLTGWSKNACHKRLTTFSNWEQLTKPLKRHRTHYPLSDGTTMTAPDLAKIIGSATSTACLRLQKSNDRATLVRPLENKNQRNMTNREKWSNKDTIIVMGIPLNPSYMDGQTNGSPAKDRNGNKMSFAEASSLMRYRKEQREEWLHSKGLMTADEEDKAASESENAMEEQYNECS